MIRENSGAPTSQRGFSLPVAVFIIVVLAVIGAMMVTIGGVQSATAAAAAQGARAYHAARAGIEWGIYETVAPGGPLRACPLVGPPSGSFGFPGVAELAGFGVVVTCTESAHQEHGASTRVVVLTAVATFGAFGTPDYVSRTLHATVTNAVPP